MKAWLSQAGVAFIVRNVDDDLSAYEELVARGFRSVPVTLIGDEALTGYQPDALAAAISRAAAD